VVFAAAAPPRWILPIAMPGKLLADLVAGIFRVNPRRVVEELAR
jgi:hypothetical protein